MAGVGNDSSNYLMKIGCALYLVMEVQTERPYTSGLARIHLYWSFIAVSGLGRFSLMLYPHGLGSHYVTLFHIIVHQRLFLICWPNGLC